MIKDFKVVLFYFVEYDIDWLLTLRDLQGLCKSGFILIETLAFSLWWIKVNWIMCMGLEEINKSYIYQLQ